MKRIGAVFASLMICSMVAHGGVYAICDVWKAEMFWIDTDRACAYGNQLLLWAAITDYNGTEITDEALVIYDMTWRNTVLIMYANYCTLCPAWNGDYAHAMIALIGHSHDASDTDWFEDSIFFGRITLDKQGSHSIRPLVDRASRRGSGSAKDGTIPNTEVRRALDSAKSAIHLRSGLGHDYYLYDLYQINWDTYCYTMIVEGSFGTTEGLMFFNSTLDGYDIIMVIFENDALYGYCMAGVFDPWVRSQFAVITLDYGFVTTLSLQ